MTIDEAIKKLTAKSECMRQEISETDDDCKYRNCDECSLRYEQGTTGEQIEAIQIAIDALVKLQEMLPTSMSGTSWIPCIDRLPEEDGWYLTTYDGEICNREGEVFTGMSEFENGKWEEDTVYAWMPLPEPWRKP